MLVGAVKLLTGLGIALLSFPVALMALASQPYWPALASIVVLLLLVAAASRLARSFGATLGLVLLAIGALVGWSQATAVTPPIRDAAGNVIPGSVAAVERLSLGGVEQAVLIRGRSTTNPVLLYLAGGPGGTQIAWNQQFNQPLEDRFVVVQWEQRGAGLSGGAVFADWARMTPRQYAADGLELVSYLRDRFGARPVYLVAQSWGTIPAVWMLDEKPDWFAAYVGVGQMVNPVETDTLGYAYVLDHARAEGRTAVVDDLVAYGPPPYHGLLDMTRYQRLIGAMNEYQAREIAADPEAAYPSMVGMTDSPEYGIADTVAAFLGGGITFARVYDQLDDVDLDSQVPKLDVPVWFVEGRHDLNSFPVLAERYLSALDAPAKHLVWFEHAGHNPMHEDAARFNSLLVEEVLVSPRAT
jgi:pimeloyl-ACP methyl ester carboxylesterase